MPTNSSSRKRILAIDPFTRGFGYAVLDETKLLVDWGKKQAERQFHRHSMLQCAKLLKRYQPKVVVLEDVENSRKSMRIKDRLAGFIELARAGGFKVVFIKEKIILKHFASRGARTRLDMARLLAKDFPELAFRLPQPRKAWTSQDLRIHIFGAAALALTHFQTKKKTAIADRPEK